MQYSKTSLSPSSKRSVRRPSKIADFRPSFFRQKSIEKALKWLVLKNNNQVQLIEGCFAAFIGCALVEINLTSAFPKPCNSISFDKYHGAISSGSQGIIHWFRS